MQISWDQLILIAISNTFATKVVNIYSLEALIWASTDHDKVF